MGRKAGFAAGCSLIFNYIAIDMKSHRYEILYAETSVIYKKTMA